MDIKVVDATGRTVEATVPGDAPVGRVVDKLVEMLEIAAGPDGQPLPYRFHHMGSEISDSETLEEAGVRDGDVLRLVAELTAGGRVYVGDDEPGLHHAVRVLPPVRDGVARTEAARELAHDIQRLHF